MSVRTPVHEAGGDGYAVAMDTAPSAAEILGQFSFDPLWLVLLVGCALAYATAFRRSRMSGRQPHSTFRLAAFMAGLGVASAAVLSPVEHYGNQLLWVDFLGFLLLTMLAAPLLVLGAPLTLAFRVSGETGRRRLRRFYRSRPMAMLTFPVAAWLLFAIVTYAWQFTQLTTIASRTPWVRDIQLLSLLTVAILFWMPALCSDPMRWRMAHPLRAFYVTVEMVHKGLFGGMFLSAATPFHEEFAANAPAWAPDAITDQRLGILILWIGGNAFFLVALAGIVLAWVAFERRHQHRTDWHLDLARAADRRRQAALAKVFERR